jgi:hypothetical protein
LVKPSDSERTGEAGSNLPREEPDLPEPLAMAIAMLICFGVSFAAAYVVMEKSWGLLVKLYVGANGVLFGAAGLAAVVNALRAIVSRFTAKSRAGIPAESKDGRETGC